MSITSLLAETGTITRFAGRFFREGFRPRYEVQEFMYQCYTIGYQSLPLVGITGFIIGLVLTLRLRPTMVQFGAESWIPVVVGLTIIQELSPIITGLMVAGKVGSNIGAELSSMRVPEQIDAMDVSGTNPFKYLVVTQVLAATLMVPVLTLLSDAIGLLAAFVGVNMQGSTTLLLFINHIVGRLTFGQVLPAVMKTFFFGFISCYKGYYASNDTAGVGRAANSAVVAGSLAVFLLDLVAVLVSTALGLIYTSCFVMLPSPAPAAVAAPPAPAEAVLTVAGVSLTFGSTHVLQDFSLTLNRGENIVVLGKSGAGKSVLIKCIVGLLKPDAGTITVLGQDLAGLDHAGLDRLRTKLGFLFQSNALYDSMTVRENLLFPLRRQWLAHTPAQEAELVKQALEDVGLADTAELLPAALSGGMRKRIPLARTLILRPDIILYDEPTTGLDPITAREIDHLIREVQKKYNTSVLIISHDLACVRLTADRVALLAEGRYYAEGTYAEVSTNADPQVHDFSV